MQISREKRPSSWDSRWGLRDLSHEKSHSGFLLSFENYLSYNIVYELCGTALKFRFDWALIEGSSFNRLEMTAELLKKFFRPLINQFLRIRRRGEKTKKNPPIRSFLELSTINSSNSTVFGTLLDDLPTNLSLLYFSIKNASFGDVFSPLNPMGRRIFVSVIQLPFLNG